MGEILTQELEDVDETNKKFSLKKVQTTIDTIDSNYELDLLKKIDLT